MSREMLYIAEETMHMRVEEEHRRAGRAQAAALDPQKPSGRRNPGRVDRWPVPLGPHLDGSRPALEQHGILQPNDTPNTRGP